MCGVAIVHIRVCAVQSIRFQSERRESRLVVSSVTILYVRFLYRNSLCILDGDLRKEEQLGVCLCMFALADAIYASG